MIWLTGRQFRVQAIVAAIALVALAIPFAVTGPGLAHRFSASGIATCAAAGTCATLRTTFLGEVTADPGAIVAYLLGLAILYLTPAIAGMFWGAPLLTRELETGTLRLTLTQSVTRARWIAVKLGLIGAAVAVFTGGLSLIITWWAGPIDEAAALPGVGQALPNRFVPLVFGARGIAPVGYAVCAFVLGVAIGAFVRRTVPAMAVTLAAVAAIQVVMPTMVRPQLEPAVRTTVAFDTRTIERIVMGDNNSMTLVGLVNIPGAWIISAQTITPAGQPFIGPAPVACRIPSPSEEPCLAAIDRLQLRQGVTYQPAGRYWTFQWLETAVLLILAAALAALCGWRMRRLRLT